ncbi:hypothetical protein K458DRAFT_424314 [Lentithecium fluviatile CBS 122367]|uniref:ABM domain-containing protein n=1 Tax=Lentithecium fluviatile CBS 122367 TaxID=1168545 RepID=A0A6G1IG46_9PLEO|nr:hypothetical protein K458DRAFT_424314 [Lentithecium fluviatile CBS 122367]
MAYAGPFLSVHITLHIDPTKLDTFFEVVRTTYDAVTAEPENIFFEVYQSADKPGVFRFVEHWNASMEWMTNVCYASDETFERH